MSERYFRTLLSRHGRFRQEIDREQRMIPLDWLRVNKLRRLCRVIQDRMQRTIDAATVPQMELAPARVRHKRGNATRFSE